MRLIRMPRSFYLQPTLKVASDLLGLFLVRKVGKKMVVGKIVEVEAYLGSKDPASHAFRGKTPRNEAMFLQGGHLYVYFTYGMHFCCNVVTERKGVGHAVLLRALEPIEGIEVMRRRRHLRSADDSTALCGGPARLCQAFMINKRDNGIDLCGKDIWIGKQENSPDEQGIARSARVGITSGKHHRWRFYRKGSPYVSPGRPST